MREIEFRAWNKKDKYMDNDFFVRSDGQVWDYAFLTYDTQNVEIDKTQDLILMQYTGLKEKNGVKIFEGDIIPTKIGIGITAKTIFAVVKFSTKDVASCGCCVPSFSGSGFVAEDKNGDRRDIDDDCEVIGNIYENPELLKQEQSE